MPIRATWLSFYGTAVLCGIRFTMSLFIGSLAFEEIGVNLLIDERLGALEGDRLRRIDVFSLTLSHCRRCTR